MLKTVDPIISGSLLAAVDRAQAGRWIAISSLGAPSTRAIASDASVDRLAAALFPLLPISAHTPSPLIAWLSDPSDEEGIDAFYAVQGTARDSERRTFEMQTLSSIPDYVWDNVDAVITVDARVDFVFFVCVGGEPHTVVDLTQQNARQAA
jgi:L-fucose mutarotase/ribose pyranase (RbsD/FucU family)